VIQSGPAGRRATWSPYIPCTLYGGAAYDAALEVPPAPACIKHFVMACVYSDPMDTTPAGLTDKLYWRKARGEWHCFEKLAQVRGFVSLCQRREIAIVLGQQIARPEAHLRCGLCDGLEMARRGWEGAGPVSPRRARSFSR
jgi:hypothetical protein